MIEKSSLTIGSIAAIACSLEVAAPKPGNVHRGADFSDLVLQDFLVSGTILGQVIDQCATMPIGATILEVIQSTRQVVGTNTNLGIALLVVPLAKAAQAAQAVAACNQKLTPEILGEQLAGLTREDTLAIYEAIRVAKPGGLGSVETGDVLQPPPDDLSLIELMGFAADRDLIARQYTNRFEQVFDFGVLHLQEGRSIWPDLSQAIVFAHIAFLAEFPDSLIARKCGANEALQAQRMAGRVLEKIRLHAAELEAAPAVEVDQDLVWNSVGEFDFWLRAKGNRRNPGTTADLVAASLFVAIYNGVVLPPYR